MEKYYLSLSLSLSHTHTHIHTHTYIYTHTFSHTHSLYLVLSLSLFSLRLRRLRRNAEKYAARNGPVRGCVCMCVCMYVCVCDVCMYVCLCDMFRISIMCLSIHIHTYSYTHIRTHTCTYIGYVEIRVPHRLCHILFQHILQYSMAIMRETYSYIHILQTWMGMDLTLKRECIHTHIHTHHPIHTWTYAMRTQAHTPHVIHIHKLIQTHRHTHGRVRRVWVWVCLLEESKNGVQRVWVCIRDPSLLLFHPLAIPKRERERENDNVIHEYKH